MSLTRLTAAVALIIAPVAAGATALIDGSFEAKGAASAVSAYCYDGFSAGGNAPCAASPWHGSGVIHTGNSAWGRPMTPDGSYLSFVQGTQSLSQSFTATSSSMLHATWLDANRGNYGGIQTYTVTVSEGATTSVLGTYTSAVGGFVGRSSANFAFVAGKKYALAFNGQATGDSTAFVDKVALVPEPRTWAMLLVGFGLIGVVQRRRSAKLAVA